jgi:hypothetical protein
MGIKDIDYYKVIEDFNNGTLDRDEIVLVMDNDGGYWDMVDEEDDEVRSETIDKLENKYGLPSGYRDIVEVLNASGVNAEWC